VAATARGLVNDKGRYQRLITQWAHGVTAISDPSVNVCDRDLFCFEAQVQQAWEMLGQRSKQ